jgi:hypothetical protein
MIITGEDTNKCSIDGFVEINGETYRLKSLKDLIYTLEKASQIDKG